MARQRTIAVLLFDQVNSIDVTGPLEAFACVTHTDGSQAYAVASWAIDDIFVKCESGLSFAADSLLPLNPEADILLIPGGKGIREPETLKRISNWLIQHHSQFERIAAVCTGAYPLAASGLMDGRTLTTHWAHAEDLQKSYPKVDVKADFLFLRDGRYYSSGGVTAGIDLALDLIESDFGGRTAMNVARHLVVFLRRSGSQAQFSMPLKLQVTATGGLSEVCQWAANNLDADLSVETLASRTGLSPRQFSRRFRAAFNVPPGAFIKRLRLDAGRILLGQGIPLSQVTHATGFLSTDGFRRAFEQQFGITPNEYKKRFRARKIGK